MKTARKLFALAAVLLLVAAAATTCVAGETAKGIIRGTVTYARQPVSGVTVSIDGGKKTVKTNEKGLFELKEIVPGEYKVEASGIAKNTRRQATTNIVVPEGDKTDVTVTLELK